MTALHNVGLAKRKLLTFIINEKTALNGLNEVQIKNKFIIIAHSSSNDESIFN